MPFSQIKSMFSRVRRKQGKNFGKLSFLSTAEEFPLLLWNQKLITLLSQVIIFIANYVISKVFVFRKKDEPAK